MRAVAAIGLAVIALATLVAAPAGADETRQPIGDQPAVLEIDPAWRTVTASAISDAPALVMRHQDGAVLAVTVAMAPNLDAYRTRQKAAWIADIVAGFGAAAGVKAGKPTLGKLGTVPTIDLWLERRTDDGTETVAVRLLLFHTRTIAVAASGGARKVLAAAIAALVPRD